MDGTDRHDGRILRIDIARHDALQRRDERRRGNHGIDGVLRFRAMPAPADNADIGLVDRRHGRTRHKTELRRRHARPIVQAEHRIHGKALEKAFRQHFPRPGADFFGGLEDEMQRAVEGTALREIPGGREKDRGVTVVSASVHDPGVCAGIGEVRGLLDRQRIHIGADAEPALAGSVGQRRHDTRAGDARGYVVAPRRKPGGDKLAGAALLKGQLRILMQVASQGDDLVEIGCNPLLDGIVEAGWVCDDVHGFTGAHAPTAFPGSRASSAAA